MKTGDIVVCHRGGSHSVYFDRAIKNGATLPKEGELYTIREPITMPDNVYYHCRHRVYLVELVNGQDTYFDHRGDPMEIAWPEDSFEIVQEAPTEEDILQSIENQHHE